MEGDNLTVGSRECTYLLDCFAESVEAGQIGGGGGFGGAGSGGGRAVGNCRGPVVDHSGGVGGKETGPNVTFDTLDEIFRDFCDRGIWGCGVGLGYEGVESLLLCCLAAGGADPVEAGARSGERYWALALKVMAEVQTHLFFLVYMCCWPVLLKHPCARATCKSAWRLLLSRQRVRTCTHALALAVEAHGLARGAGGGLGGLLCQLQRRHTVTRRGLPRIYNGACWREGPCQIG